MVFFSVCFCLLGSAFLAAFVFFVLGWRVWATLNCFQLGSFLPQLLLISLLVGVMYDLLQGRTAIEWNQGYFTSYSSSSPSSSSPILENVTDKRKKTTTLDWCVML